MGPEAGRGKPGGGVGAEGGSTGDGAGFFKKSLAACRGTAPAAGTDWRRRLYQQIEEEVKTETQLTVRTMCQRAGVCGAGFYRMGTANRPAQQDTALREEMQKIALEWPSYGSRRITAELRRGGWEANRKRVQRLLREDNLLCLRKRQFVVTDRKSTRLNSSHLVISYAVFCLKKKK